LSARFSGQTGKAGYFMSCISFFSLDCAASHRALAMYVQPLPLQLFWPLQEFMPVAMNLGFILGIGSGEGKTGKFFGVQG
jgi:hypothetical protein